MYQIIKCTSSIDTILIVSYISIKLKKNFIHNFSHPCRAFSFPNCFCKTAIVLWLQTVSFPIFL